MIVVKALQLHVMGGYAQAMRRASVVQDRVIAMLGPTTVAVSVL